MAGYSFQIGFYATGLRGDDVSAALGQLAPIAARYGATHWAAYRSQEDFYKFLIVADFPEKQGFQRFWYGPEASDFRAEMSGKFQNPVTYVAHEILVEGHAVVAAT